MNSIKVSHAVLVSYIISIVASAFFAGKRFESSIIISSLFLGACLVTFFFLVDSIKNLLEKVANEASEETKKSWAGMPMAVGYALEEGDYVKLLYMTTEKPIVALVKGHKETIAIYLTTQPDLKVGRHYVVIDGKLVDLHVHTSGDPFAADRV